MLFRRRREDQPSKDTHAEKPEENDTTLHVGSVILDRYRCTGILGVGNVGTVYLARDMKMNRLVAVKEMLNLASDPNVREMTLRNFQREASIIADLNHPAIPHIYDHVATQDMTCLIMEYISGRDLEAVINSMPEFLPFDIVKKWALEMCDVLHYLHSHRPEPIIFRNVEPSNVMIDDGNAVKLVGFSLAVPFEPNQRESIQGSEGYSPPEQYHGLASPASDQYMLGATLHHVLTRRDPRVEIPFSFSERPIQAANPSVPEAFAVIVARALAYNPAARWSNASAMAEAIKALG